MNNNDGFFDQLRKQQSPTADPGGSGTTGSLFGDEEAVQPSVSPPPAPPVRQTAKEPKRRVAPAPPEQKPVIAPPALAATQDAPSETPGLPPEAKRALVSLLRYGVIIAAQKSKIFEVVCRYQSDFRRHLADMYLKLVLDEKSGVAFVASIDEGDLADTSSDGTAEEETVSLITRRTLTLYDTLLLLVLRKHYQERETSGEQKMVIDIERIESNLSPFLPLTNSSKSDRKKLNAALQKMADKRVLSAVRGSEDRYEITPIIRYVVNAEFLEGLLAEYMRLAEEAAGDDAPSEQAAATHSQQELR